MAQVSKICNMEKYIQVYYHLKHVTSIDIHNSILASGSADSQVQVWNLKKSLKLFEVTNEQPVNCVKIVGKVLVSCGGPLVRIWSLADGELLDTLQLLDWCYNFDLSHEGTLLAVVHHIGVSIYDFSTRFKIMEKEPGVDKVQNFF